MKISRIVEKMKPSGIREFFDLVIGMKDVISLGVGEPDFVTPWNICESAIFSLEKGYTSYTSNKGLYELRLAIFKYLKNKYSLSYNPDQNILITTGVSEAVDLALRAILNRGDKILIPDPSYVSYEPVSELAGGKAILVKTSEADNFKLTPRLLKKYISKGVKAIILNYPNNPTGVSYSRKELLALSKIFVNNNLIVISDEIYDELTYDFSHTPLATLPGMKQRTIYLNGFSKTFAMTGWRVGYACGPEEIINAMTKIHQYTMLCSPIMGQLGAIEALRGSSGSVLEMKREYKRRKEFIVSKLNEIGLYCAMPEGTFYVFPSIKNTGMSSVEFAKSLLYKEKVAVVPGTAFGSQGEGHIRIAYASSMDNLKEATERIKHFLKNNVRS
ncbi:MAG: aromatic amino acid aminotransferase [Omnitrophica bacterium GWA2_41_15]|nr:MAG: aromatic amino acid aminotransferase [Omnitrophica bacterium GWA2_41_15]HAZ10506.1 pyridoxal phosphate-dependent aminotransferase [Candidatus Omnitrophota bacterium]